MDERYEVGSDNDDIEAYICQNINEYGEFYLLLQASYCDRAELRRRGSARLQERGTVALC